MSDTTYIEDAIYEHLVEAAAISAVVGSRVYPNLLPNGTTYPALMYRPISSNRDQTHNAETGSFVKSRWEFNCYGASYTEATTLARAVRAELESYQGDLGANGKTYAVDNIEIDGPRASYDQDVGTHKLQIDAMIQHRE
tara:strand:- start:1870 stop:2286 length:417 start_codon:yes stop_codon:yes gene_type:complete